MGKVITVALPDIGEGVVEGEVIEWRKQVGDAIAQDEPVVVVMTDKATVELPSPAAGKLVQQYKKVGEIAVKNQPLYSVETAEKEVAGPQNDQQSVKQAAPPVKQKDILEKQEIAETPLKTFIEKTGKKALASPHTRQLAKELHLDINQIVGSGKEGRVTEEDVVQFHAQSYIPALQTKSSGRAAPEIHSSTPVLHMDGDEELPLAGIRHIIAEKMVESKYIVPHFSFFDQADATHLVVLRDTILKEATKFKVNVTFMPFFIKALSLALAKYPAINGSVDMQSDRLIIHKHHNIGVAARGPNGLLVFTIKNVQNMTFYDVLNAYNELSLKVKEGKLEREDLQESTITISNFGPLGGQWATPIINYPEIAILGLAKMRKMPVVKDDVIVIRQMLNLSWSFDHRVIDGEAAGAISNAFIHLIENPTQLIEK